MAAGPLLSPMSRGQQGSVVRAASYRGVPICGARHVTATCKCEPDSQRCWALSGGRCNLTPMALALALPVARDVSGLILACSSLTPPQVLSCVQVPAGRLWAGVHYDWCAEGCMNAGGGGGGKTAVHVTPMCSPAANSAAAAAAA